MNIERKDLQSWQTRAQARMSVRSRESEEEKEMDEVDE